MGPTFTTLEHCSVCIWTIHTHSISWCGRGGVAGYLEADTDSDGGKAGAIVELVAFLPFVAFVAVALGVYPKEGL